MPKSTFLTKNVPYFFTFLPRTLLGGLTAAMAHLGSGVPFPKRSVFPRQSAGYSYVLENSVCNQGRFAIHVSTRVWCAVILSSFVVDLLSWRANVLITGAGSSALLTSDPVRWGRSYSVLASLSSTRWIHAPHVRWVHCRHSKGTYIHTAHTWHCIGLLDFLATALSGCPSCQTSEITPVAL